MNEDTVKRHALKTKGSSLVQIDYQNAPGAIARNWYHTHETAIGGRTALHDLIPTQILPITDPKHSALIFGETQAELPAVPPQEPERREIPYIKHLSNDNPTLQLHGACIATMQRFQRFPAAVFVAYGRIPVLMVETEAMTGKKYDGYFRLYHSRGPAWIAVFSEAMLPKEIKEALPGGHIPLNMVIALTELDGYNPVKYWSRDNGR